MVKKKSNLNNRLYSGSLDLYHPLGLPLQGLCCSWEETSSFLSKEEFKILIRTLEIRLL